jgi:hypothetical protein
MKRARRQTKQSMSLGITPPSGALYGSTRAFCEERLAPTSIYRLLAEQGGRLFADESFADLFHDAGRRSVPPRIVATVMVLLADVNYIHPLTTITSPHRFPSLLPS